MNFDQDRVCLIGCFYLILAEQVESFLFDQAIDTGLVPGRLFDQDKIFSQVVFPGGLLMAGRDLVLSATIINEGELGMGRKR